MKMKDRPRSNYSTGHQAMLAYLMTILSLKFRAQMKDGLAEKRESLGQPQEQGANSHSWVIKETPCEIASTY